MNPFVPLSIQLQGLERRVGSIPNRLFVNIRYALLLAIVVLLGINPTAFKFAATVSPTPNQKRSKVAVELLG